MTQLQSIFSAINPLKDLVIPLAAAWFGVWMATGKFKKEHLWTEKYSAYQKVFHSLEVISHWSSETVSDVYFQPSVGTKGLHDEYGLAQRDVLRHTAIGSLLLSSPFLEQLEQFQAEFFQARGDAFEDRYDDGPQQELAWGEHASKVQGIVTRHLPILIELARKDLDANESWMQKSLRGMSHLGITQPKDAVLAATCLALIYVLLSR